MIKLAILSFLLFSQLYAMENEESSTQPLLEKIRKKVTFDENTVEREPSAGFIFRKKGNISAEKEAKKAAEKEMTLFLGQVYINKKTTRKAMGRLKIDTQSSKKLRDEEADEELTAVTFPGLKISDTSSAEGEKDESSKSKSCEVQASEEDGWSD
ncbi:MAG: hypothetical protein K2Q34_07200 [Alphaproteobacteria bacterium]|nr:hypothetical protein [Alphaproteobacteria bacterium]